jgi:hypothetical protein
MKLDDVEKVHPMRQIAVMSVVQIIVLIFVGVSMVLIGEVSK